MNKDPKLYLGHILEAINKIQSYTRGMDRQDFHGNDLVQDASVRNIEIIGEAVKNLPRDFKSRNKEVPWNDIAGMRDRIVHFYFGLDYDLVWDTILRDIPELKKKIRKLV